MDSERDIYLWVRVAVVAAVAWAACLGGAPAVRAVASSSPAAVAAPKPAASASPSLPSVECEGRRAAQALLSVVQRASAL